MTDSSFSATKIVLIIFALTACSGFLLKLLSPELFAAALMTVLSFYYGSKQGEAAANLANAQIIAAGTKDTGAGV